MNRLNNNNKFILNIFFDIFCVFIIFSIIDTLPSFFLPHEPDSNSYIKFKNYRPAIYPLFIELCNKSNISIFFLQNLLLSLSLVVLFRAIKAYELGKVINLVGFLVIIFNIFYVAFTKTILAESLFFTAINFSIACILLYKKEQKFVYLFSGVFFGLVFSIKPAGILLALGFLLVSIFHIKNKKFIILPLIGFLFFPMIEKTIFQKKHLFKSSVFHLILIGKTIMISGEDNFKLEKFDKNERLLLDTSSEKISDVNRFLAKIKNPFLRADLTADYEVVAQYQLFRDEIKLAVDSSKKSIGRFGYDIAFKTIALHPIEYCKITITHYLGLWSTGGKLIFLNNFVKRNDLEIPYKEKLELSSSLQNKLTQGFLIIGLMFFILLMISFSSITISLFFLIFRKGFLKKNYLNICFVTLAQLYLVAICMTNVATPRYLMPVYPIIIFEILFFAKMLYNYIIKRKNYEK